MKIEIKKAILDNLNDIQDLNHKLFLKEYKDYDKTLDRGWPYTKHAKLYFKNRIVKNNGCAFVAFYDKKIVGYLVGGIYKDKSNCRTITTFSTLENMFILKEYRNKGMGKCLFDAFCKWSKSKKVKRLRVIASAENKEAIGFYRKNNFVDFELILEQNI